MNLSRFGVTAFCSLMLMAGMEARAATDTGWGDRPVWAVQDSPASTRKTLRHESQYSTSPFAPGSNNFAIDVGQVFLMGDLSAKYDNSIGSQVHYTYGVSDLFGFDASAGYSEHSDGQYSMTTLLTGLRTNLSWYDKVIPYFLFGMGFYKPSFEMNSGNNVSYISPILFGVHMGPGVDLEISKQLFFGTSLIFHDVFGTPTKTAANTLMDTGGTFTSFFLHVGFTF